MDIVKFLKEHGHLIAAVIAGTCALTAAYIRRDRRWEKSETGRAPFLGLMLPPLLSIVLGAACLAGEYFAYPIEPTGDALASDPGTMLAWVGSVLIAAGLLWLPYNLYRFASWPKPAAEEPLDVIAADAPAKGSVPVASSSVAKGRSDAVRKKPRA